MREPPVWGRGKCLQSTRSRGGQHPRSKGWHDAHMNAAFSFLLAAAVLGLAGSGGAAPMALAIALGLVFLWVLIPRLFPLIDELSASIFFIAGLVAVGGTLFQSELGGNDPGGVAYLAPVLGLAVFIVVLVQLSRRSEPEKVVQSMSINVLLLVLATAGSVWIPLSRAGYLKAPLVAACALLSAGIALSFLALEKRSGGQRIVAAAGVLLAGAVGAVVGSSIANGYNLALDAGIGAIVGATALTAWLVVSTRAGTKSMSQAQVLASVTTVFLCAGPVFALASAVVG